MNTLLSQISLSFSGLINKAYAQAGNQTITLINPFGEDAGFAEVVQRLATALITISIPIVAVMVLVGGFQMMTAGGDPEKFKSGKQTILYAAIGFAVVLVSGTVVALIKNVLGAS